MLHRRMKVTRGHIICRTEKNTGKKSKCEFHMQNNSMLDRNEQNYKRNVYIVHVSISRQNISLNAIFLYFFLISPSLSRQRSVQAEC